MKITDIALTTFRYESHVATDAEGHAHPGPARQAKATLLRITAEGGACGEAILPGAAADRAVYDKFVRPVVLGRDGLRVEAVWQALYKAQRGSGGRLTDRVVAGIDLALWDLRGRVAGQPVWKLLGGARAAVPAYGSTMCGDDIPGGLSTPEDYAHFAQWLVKERDYPAVKLHTWMPPIPGAPDPRRDYAACAAVREAVGPEIPLMLDPHHYYTRTEALWLGRKLEELGFLWMEEPMEEASMSSYRWLTSSLPALDIVGPESAAGKHWTRAEWAASGAANRLRAGVWGVGGITPALKIAHLADAFGMECEIHGTGAANLALALAIPNTSYYERGLLHPHLNYDIPRPYLTVAEDPMDSAGLVHGPDRAGLGLALDRDYIAAHAV